MAQNKKFALDDELAGHADSDRQLEITNQSTVTEAIMYMHLTTKKWHLDQVSQLETAHQSHLQS